MHLVRVVDLAQLVYLVDRAARCCGKLGPRAGPKRPAHQLSHRPIADARGKVTSDASAGQLCRIHCSAHSTEAMLPFQPCAFNASHGEYVRVRRPVRRSLPGLTVTICEPPQVQTVAGQVTERNLGAMMASFLAFRPEGLPRLGNSLLFFPI